MHHGRPVQMFFPGSQLTKQIVNQGQTHDNSADRPSVMSTVAANIMEKKDSSHLEADCSSLIGTSEIKQSVQ